MKQEMGNESIFVKPDSQFQPEPSQPEESELISSQGGAVAVNSAPPEGFY